MLQDSEAPISFAFFTLKLQQQRQERTCNVNHNNHTPLSYIITVLSILLFVAAQAPDKFCMFLLCLGFSILLLFLVVFVVSSTPRVIFPLFLFSLCYLVPSILLPCDLASLFAFPWPHVCDLDCLCVWLCPRWALGAAWALRPVPSLCFQRLGESRCMAHTHPPVQGAQPG